MSGETRWRPVFVDGPWRGRADVAITDYQRRDGVSIIDPGLLEVTLSDFTDPPKVSDFRTLRYVFTEFAMFGRLVVVGSLARPPRPDDLFAVLASAAVHSVARVPLPTGP